VQPRLAASNLFILNTHGPANPGYDEFTSLFNRNRFALQASGVVGGNRTFGDEVVHSAVWNNFAYSLGQFHYETEGFRRNNDLEQDIYNVFAQARLTQATSVQVEWRQQMLESGDLQLRFDPDNFRGDLRQTDRSWSIRGGLRHSLAPGSDVLASFIYQSARGRAKSEFFSITVDEAGYMGEPSTSSGDATSAASSAWALRGTTTGAAIQIPIEEIDEVRWSRHHSLAAASHERLRLISCMRRPA
jgi:hypothetical protein